MRSKNGIELFNQIVSSAIALIVVVLLVTFISAIAWKIFMWIMGL